MSISCPCFIELYISSQLTLEIFLTPPSEVRTSTSARSSALSILLKPLWHCNKPTRLLTSPPLRRLPVNVLKLRTTLASLLNWIRAIRPPDGDTLKYVTNVWTKYSKRFQLLLSSQSDESIMKVVSIGMGHISSIEKKKSRGHLRK